MNAIDFAVAGEARPSHTFVESLQGTLARHARVSLAHHNNDGERSSLGIAPKGFTDMSR